MENVKTRVKPETIKRYYDVLVRLEKMTNTDNGKVIKLGDFIAKNKLSTKTGAILVNRGILKKMSVSNGRQGACYSYKWKTIAPSMQMAKAVISEINIIQTLRRSKSNKTTEKADVKKVEQIVKVAPIAKVTRRKVTPKKQVTEVIQGKEISILWGMFKYKTN